MSITSNCKLIPLHLSLLPNPNPKLPFPNPNPPPLSPPKLLSIRCAKRSQRTGKYRYPSEKKKLKSRRQTQIDVPQKFEGFWRLSKLGVSVHRDPGKDFLDVSDALLEEIAKVLEFPVASMLPPEAFSVVRKSFDARNREFERRAATMGGGNFVVPVQTVTDFLENKLSGASVPPSSHRLGVKVASLHELFPNNITEALQNSLSMFDKELPGFISSNALLHGVETRTSSPVQIPRNTDTYESTSLKGLYPVGEGAGYAGGIVSAAVDGMYAGFAVAKNIDLYRGSIDSLLGKAQNPSFTNY